MRFKSSLAVTALLTAFAAFFAAPAPAQQAAATPVCANCHAESHASTVRTVHGAKNDASGSACQACHGDASAHVKDPLKVKMTNVFAKGAPAEQKTAACMSCHSGSRQLAFWQSGQHQMNGVSCDNCHDVHGGQAMNNDKMLKVVGATATPYTTTARQLAYQTCVGCHKDKRAEILKPSHHPIVEGKVGCHDCHDPHGALTPVMLKAESYQDLCVSCHADKRGPWIHEHPPVMENCATCHTPHGSAHNRLLAQKPPALCADCHPGGHTHGLYDGRGTLPGVLPSNIRFEGSGCVGCHRQIHGSNAPASAYGNFFLR